MANRTPRFGFDGKHHDYDVNAVFDNHGHHDPILSRFETAKKKISETQQVFTYGWKKGRAPKYATWQNHMIGKHFVIGIRNHIGMSSSYSWVSRSWVECIRQLSGLPKYIVPKHPPEITIAYFYMKWMQNIPSDICSIIAEYAQPYIDPERSCTVCNKVYISDMSLRRHFKTKMHRRNCIKRGIQPLVPTAD